MAILAFTAWSFLRITAGTFRITITDAQSGSAQSVIIRLRVKRLNHWWTLRTRFVPIPGQRGATSTLPFAWFETDPGMWKVGDPWSEPRRPNLNLGRGVYFPAPVLVRRTSGDPSPSRRRYPFKGRYAWAQEGPNILDLLA